ncbi:MAG TPA: YdcF family protein, partial [Bacteroidia bacterium]|nr:YdcF family protein [Bacteroidia bacterium]
AMFFLFSKLLEFLIKPLVWVMVLFLIGAFTKDLVRRKRCLIAAFVVLFFFTNDFIIDEFMRAWEVPAVSISDVKGTYDVGIVLGGMTVYDPHLKRIQFDRASDRLFQALTLYHAGKIKKMLIDGGSGSITESDMLEAPFIKEYLLSIGIPDSVILIEPHSRNTRENATLAKPILDKIAPNGRYLLITSASHMRRAYGCFEKLNIKTDKFSTDRYAGPRKFIFDHLFIPDKYALLTWDVLLHEWIGCITYKISGYI